MEQKSVRDVHVQYETRAEYCAVSSSPTQRHWVDLTLCSNLGNYHPEDFHQDNYNPDNYHPDCMN